MYSKNQISRTLVVAALTTTLFVGESAQAFNRSKPRWNEFSYSGGTGEMARERSYGPRLQVNFNTKDDGARDCASYLHQTGLIQRYEAGLMNSGVTRLDIGMQGSRFRDDGDDDERSTNPLWKKPIKAVFSLPGGYVEGGSAHIAIPRWYQRVLPWTWFKVGLNPFKSKTSLCEKFFMSVVEKAGAGENERLNPAVARGYEKPYGEQYRRGPAGGPLGRPQGDGYMGEGGPTGYRADGMGEPQPDAVDPRQALSAQEVEAIDPDLREEYIQTHAQSLVDEANALLAAGDFRGVSELKRQSNELLGQIGKELRLNRTADGGKHFEIVAIGAPAGVIPPAGSGVLPPPPPGQVPPSAQDPAAAAQQAAIEQAAREKAELAQQQAQQQKLERQQKAADAAKQELPRELPKVTALVTGGNPTKASSADASEAAVQAVTELEKQQKAAQEAVDTLPSDAARRAQISSIASQDEDKKLKAEIQALLVVQREKELNLKAAMAAVATAKILLLDKVSKGVEAEVQKAKAEFDAKVAAMKAAQSELTAASKKTTDYSAEHIMRVHWFAPADDVQAVKTSVARAAGFDRDLNWEHNWRGDWGFTMQNRHMTITDYDTLNLVADADKVASLTTAQSDSVKAFMP